MKKRLIICIVLLLLLIPLINNFYPKNVGKIIQAEMLSKNTTKVTITKYDGMHEKGKILITDKTKIQELINYLSKRKVRKSFNFGTTRFSFDKQYKLEFYEEDNISILDIYDSIYDNNYLTVNIGFPSKIITYKFTSDFNPDYINNLHN